jgi:hypothetical protein
MKPCGGAPHRRKPIVAVLGRRQGLGHPRKGEDAAGQDVEEAA